MLKNYLLVALRLIRRNPGISVINIGGLAIAMSATLIILQYVAYQFSFDRFHKDHENIYRLGLVWSWADSKGRQSLELPINDDEVIKNIADELPEVRRTAWFSEHFEIEGKIVRKKGNLWLSKSRGSLDKQFKTKKYITAGKSYFEIFDFKGDILNGALSNPNEVILSKEAADKIFGTEDALHKTLFIQGVQPIKVVGVYSLPPNSSLQYDFIFSTSQKSFSDTRYQAFIQLHENTDVGAFFKKLEERYPTYYEAALRQFSQVDPFTYPILQPLKEMHFSRFANLEALKAVTYPVYVFYVLIIIGLLTSGIALANYFNLTSAQMIGRMSELGMRRLMGANRMHLLFQYFLESVIIMGISFFIALTVSQISHPFLTEMGLDYSTSFVYEKWWFAPTIFLTILLTSAVTVVAQYFIFNKNILGFLTKGKTVASDNSEKVPFQKLLMSGQFVCTTALIIGITILHKQINFILDQDLGFVKDRILVFDAPQKNNELKNVEYFFKNTRNIPEIDGITASSKLPGESNYNQPNYYYRPSKLTPYGLVSNGPIEPNFVDFYNIEIVAGRNFKKDFPADTNALLLSEHALLRLEFQSYEDALSSTVMFNKWTLESSLDTTSHKAFKVIGVFKDYQNDPLHEIQEQNGLALFLNADNSKTAHNYFYAKLKPNAGQGTIDQIRSLYKESFSSATFDSFFLDEKIEAHYNDDHLLRSVLLIFTGIAILISCMGLFALTSILLVRKTKEIGIRKVLGASLFNIFRQFANSYFILISITSLVAIPIVWYLASEWLSSYAVRIDLTWEVFIVPVMLLALLVMILLFAQVKKVTRTNPVESLRYE